MGNLSVGLIGCGAISNAHMEHFYRNSSPAVDLVACADLDATTLDSFSNMYGIADAYNDPAELLARSDIDVVDICTPAGPRPDLISAAASAGKHVICEKPLALDYGAAVDAIAAADRAGTRVGVMQNYRFRPEYIEARNWITGGRIGKPFMGTLQGLFHWDGSVAYRRAAERMLMIEQTYHYVDLLRFVLDSDVVRVYAAAGRPETSQIAGESYVALILHFDNGAVGNIVNSGECRGAHANWGGESVFQAEEGTIYLNYRKLYTFSIYGASAGGHVDYTYPAEMYGLSTNAGFDKPLDAFYMALQSGDPLPVSASDNLNTLGAVLAAYESAETGNAVSLAAFIDG